MNEFEGLWVRRGSIMVPVLTSDPPKVTCKICGSPSPAALCRPCRESDRKRVHGSHAGFAQHQRRHENPCQACSDAERVYQKARYRRGQLSERDREWAEKNAVKSSWNSFQKFNRTARLPNIT